MKYLLHVSFLPEPPSVAQYLAHPGVQRLLQAKKQGGSYAYPIEFHLHEILKDPKYADLKIARRVQNISKRWGTRQVTSVFYSTPLLKSLRFTSFLFQGFGFLRENATQYKLHNATGYRAVTRDGNEAGNFSITRPSFNGRSQYVITYYFGDYDNRELIQELFEKLEKFEAVPATVKEMAMSA